MNIKEIKCFLIKYIYIFTAIFFMINSSLYGTIHYDGEMLEFMQPDKTIVSLKVYGDEYYRRYETEEGYTVIRNEDKSWVYAQLNEAEDEFLSTDFFYEASKTFQESQEVSNKNMQKGMNGFLDEVHLEKGIQLNQESIKAIREKNLEEKEEYHQLFEEKRRLYLQKKSQEKVTHTHNHKEESGLNFLSFSDIEQSNAEDELNSITGLTVIVNFSDITIEEYGISTENIDDLINQSDYTDNSGQGSVKDYYLEDALEITGHKIEPQSDCAKKVDTRKKKNSGKKQ